MTALRNTSPIVGACHVEHSRAVDFRRDERHCRLVFTPDAIQEVHVVGVEKVIVGSN